MVALKQSSFSGGVIAPNLYGRSDLSKWQAGLTDASNFWVNRYGNAENRPGTQFGGYCKAGITTFRLIPFVVSAANSFVFEIGNGYLRIWQNDGPLYQDSTIAALWSNATTYASGDLVYVLSGGLRFLYVSLADGNLNHDPAGGPPQPWAALPMVTINAVRYGITEIPMPWVTADVPTIQYAQINDIVTFVGHGFAPVQLVHRSNTQWARRQNVLNNPIGRPTAMAITGPAGAVPYNYTVVSVGPDLTTQSGMGITPATPNNVQSITVNSDGSVSIVLSVPVGYTVGNPVFLDFTSFSGIRFSGDYTVASGAGANYTLTGGPGGAPVSYSGLGGLYPEAITGAFATPSSATPITITWTGSPTASRYNIYRYYLGVYSFVGTTTQTTFDDINITPNTGFQPSVNIPMFLTPNDWPAAVGIYQQRLWFGNSLNQPQSYWASRVGQYGVFNVSTPSNDADAFTFVLAGTQVQFINAFVDIGKLIIHTSNGEYVVNGNAGGTVTPTAQNVVKAGQSGSFPGPMPLAIGLSDLFVQARGSQIHDLQFDIKVYNYSGKNTTFYVGNIFDSKTIVDMAWQQTPNSLVWVVFSDGSMAVMTYIKEEEMWAWMPMSTQLGAVRAIAVIPEGGVDSLYWIVERPLSTTPGDTVFYLERMYQRIVLDYTADANFLDSALSYDGRVTNGDTVTLSTGGGWTPSDLITVTASAAHFTAANASNGDIIVVRQVAAGGMTAVDVQIVLSSYTSGTVVAGHPVATIPSWARGGAIPIWGIATNKYSGAQSLYPFHLITVLGDGITETTITVNISGQFTTAGKYLILHGGIPIAARFQTLDWENAQGETVAQKRKDINELTVFFVASVGGVYGTTLGKLWDFQDAPAYLPTDGSTPPTTNTGARRFSLAGAWNPTATVYVAQNKPLPLCIGAIIPGGGVGN